MPCYHPVSAWRDGSGSVVFVERGDVRASLFLPCTNCIGCRLDYASMWESRIMHEARCWPDNSFVTLTYDDAHVSSDRSLVYSDFQAFMRRLRKRFKDTRIRFFVAGEYGEEFERPHFHMALFNLAFRDDRKYWRKTEAGFRVDRSSTLESLWQFGNSEIGELTSQSANYIARYIVKKVNGDRAFEHYRTLDASTGELTWRVPEFCRMSLRPGIGGTWFEKFGQTDAVAHDRLTRDGVHKKLPRYYDKLQKRLDAVRLEEMKDDRVIRGKRFAADNTDARLAVRELVDKERMKFYKRGIK